MNHSTPVTVTPREPGDPEPDVFGLLLAHRAMLRDLHRLTDLMQQIAAGNVTPSTRRARAIAGYLDDLCTSIHHHHSNEDDVLWPVLEQSAGPQVDLTELSDDHRVLEPKLARIRAGAAALRSNPAPSPRELAADLADLRDTLVEHITDEEQSIIPVIRTYVSVKDWKAVETAIRSNGAKVSFEAPRVLAVATPQELAAIKAEISFPLTIMVALMPRIFRRRERLVFGTA